MAHYLDISDGTITFVLANPPTTLTTDYVPSTPNITAQEIKSELEDGGDVTVVTNRNVTETASLLLTAATKPDLQTIVRTINGLLQKAHRRQSKKTGPRVYLRIQVDGEVGVNILHQSEILSGRLVLNQDALNSGWPNIKIGARLIITRRFFWEQTNIVELLISSQAGTTPAIGGKTIHNHKDSGHGNYIQVASTQLSGDLPAPVKIYLANNSGSSQDYRHIYLATNALSDPLNFTHIIEGEDARSGWGTDGSDSGCSNGAYTTQTFTGTTYFKWDLLAGLLADTAGRWFRILVRFLNYTTTTPIYIEPRIMDGSGLLDLAVVEEETLLPVSGGSAYQLLDLGALPFPPGGYHSAWATQTLAFKLRAAASVTVSIDYIQLTPLDSFRHLVQRGMTIPNGDGIIDDGIEGLTYSFESSVAHPIYSPRGAPLYVFPGYDQRIYVLHDEGTPSVIANSFLAQLYYRPRRLIV